MDPHVATDLIQTAAATAASWRLIHLKLAKQFSALLAFLVFLAVINLVLGLMKDGSTAYFWAYLAIEPAKCIVSILAVLQLFALTFEHYPGIRSASRWAIYLGVGLSMVISLVVTGFFWNGSAAGRAHSHLFYFETLVRAVMLGLALAIVTNLVLLSRYPLNLSRNTLISSAFFSALFLSEACSLLLDSLMPQLYNRYIDTAQGFFVCVSLAGWACMLTPETVLTTAKVRFSTPQEDHLLDQLNALNHLMTRSARR